MNTGDFIVYANELDMIELRCPHCGIHFTPLNNGATIRDLVNAAHVHVRDDHRVSVRRATPVR